MNKLTLAVLGTGGGCEAYVAKLPSGMELAITHSGDPSLPDEKTEEIDVGIYTDSLWEHPVCFKTVKLEQRPGCRVRTQCEEIAYKIASQTRGTGVI